MPAQNFSLTIPIDASAINDLRVADFIKVGVQLKDGSILAQKIDLSSTQDGKANFEFPKHPGSVRIAVGPDNADDSELMGMQTINVNVSARLWRQGTSLTLSPVVITPYYWRFWLQWCRTFTVHGRIVCADGSPVPGAQVCAYDVDWWWWWCSRQQVGCATTDHTGAFEIKFRHCCGWWPRWWWSTRYWHLEPRLAEQIMPILEHKLKLKRLPRPSPRPDTDLFTQILDRDLGIFGNRSSSVSGQLEYPTILAAGRALRGKEFNPDILEDIRHKLVERVPIVPELERMRLWPWWPWTPWKDCKPDLIFRATQQCDGEARLIIDENCWDTRWNVGIETDVTLVAQEACCIKECHDLKDCPDGNCAVVTRACTFVVDKIGGNPSAVASPQGYYDPGGTDRPFGGMIPIEGVFGSGTNVHYYEFELSDDGGSVFNPMPPAAAGTFHRRYWGPKFGTSDAPEIHTLVFGFTSISGRQVVESREYFEENNEPASWGVSRFWVENADLLMNFRTENILADGTYHLRLKSWNLAGESLENDTILPLCDTDNDNGLVLTLDNRLVGAGSGHPESVPNHPSGAGTTHLRTLEPDTDITSVKIIKSGSVESIPVKPCDSIEVAEGGILLIEFLAYDPDGHLESFDLFATYGENLVSPLLHLPSSVLEKIGSVTDPAPDNYTDAVNAGATRPTWAGGTYRLTVDIAVAFPVTCAYQLELRASKRTIYNCNHSYAHGNRSGYSFSVTV